MAIGARVDGRRALLMGATDQGVELELLFRRLADADGAGHIAAIVAVSRAIIHKDEVALLDHAVAWDSVRIGRVGTRGHNG